MKRVARDQSYIDYTTDGFGVRVWNGLCRPIIHLRGRWTEHGVSYPIPVQPQHLVARSTTLSSLASNVQQVTAESDVRIAAELHGLMTGTMVFGSALASELQLA